MKTKTEKHTPTPLDIQEELANIATRIAKDGCICTDQELCNPHQVLVVSLRAVSSAQLSYALTCGGGFYAPKLTTLGTAPPASTEPYIGGGLGDADTVNKSGYTIRMEGTAYPGSPQTCNGVAPGDAAQGFTAAADPTDPNNPRFFAVNSNNSIYENTATLWGVMPENGEPAAGQPLTR